MQLLHMDVVVEGEVHTTMSGCGGEEGLEVPLVVGWHVVVE